MLLFIMYLFDYIQLNEDNIIVKLNTKSRKIIFTIQCSIKSDANEFQTWAKDHSTMYVFNLQEEKTISYEWSQYDDNSEATLVESFIDSDGAIQRLNNDMSSPIAEEVMQHVDIKEWLVFGYSKKDLIDALSPFGAKFKRQHCGFNHSLE